MAKLIPKIRIQNLAAASHGAPLSETLALAGRVIVERAQVLIVPSGQADVDDGTGNLVLLSRASGIPIAWVGGPEPWAEPEATGTERPIVRFEGL